MPGHSKIDRLKSLLNHFGALALDAVFPIECIGCGREGAWVCQDCFRSLKFTEGQYCLGCKRKNHFGEFCPVCRGRFFLDGVLIAGDYENELLSKAIKCVKYNLVRDAAEDLGNYLAAFLINEIKKAKVLGSDLNTGIIWGKIQDAEAAPRVFFNVGQTILIPVPLSGRRLRFRGFNQAELIARTVVDRLGATLGKAGITLETRHFIRVKHKAPQAKLGEEERKKNVAGCYVWTGGRLEGKSIILVDDVVTTGATLNECARILKQAGAGEVWGLVVAKG